MLLKFIRKIVFYIRYRLFVKGWVLGIAKGNMKDIIRNKTFNPDITWMNLKSLHCEQADPFIFRMGEKYGILIEDIRVQDFYGKIALITLNKNLQQVDHEILLDAKSHLSFPFIYNMNGKMYVFPEAAKSGKVLCYEFDQVKKTLGFVKEIIDLPLLDATILKHNDKYWLFGVMRDGVSGENYELMCYYSDDLLGTYTPHGANPLKTGLDGVRAAGNFIEVDGVLYRPAQNCKEDYGKSVAINKISMLNESVMEEEFYMLIDINKKNKYNRNITAIHTINFLDDVIVVDGVKRTFAPVSQYKKMVKEKQHAAINLVVNKYTIGHLISLDEQLIFTIYC
jgi:hypothetical protein